MIKQVKVQLEVPYIVLHDNQVLDIGVLLIIGQNSPISLKVFRRGQELIRVIQELIEKLPVYIYIYIYIYILALSESGEEIEGALSRPKTRESRYSRKHTPIESIRASRHTLEDPLEEGRELSDADGDEFSRFGDDLGADEGEAIRPVTGQSSRTKTTIKQVVSGYL